MTPTVIRHAQRGDNFVQVITYADRDSRISAVFQMYAHNTETGRTRLLFSQDFSNEEAAVQAWQCALLGARELNHWWVI